MSQLTRTNQENVSLPIATEVLPPTDIEYQRLTLMDPEDLMHLQDDPDSEYEKFVFWFILGCFGYIILAVVYLLVRE